MAYTKTTWVDEVPNETPQKYVITGANNDCTIVLKTAPTPGTPLNATNLNKIEQGIKDAHDLTKIPVTKRQGDTGDWGYNYGDTDFDVSSVPQIIQVGCKLVPATGDPYVTFPQAFSQTPIIICQVAGGSPYGMTSFVHDATEVGFYVKCYTHAGVRANCFSLMWIAIGPA